MKFFVLSFFSVVSIMAADLSIDGVRIEKEPVYTVYKKDTDMKVDGRVVSYYDDNKTIKELIPIKKGLINGEYTYYHQNGKLGTKVFYKNSKRNGLFSSFFDNGAKAAEIFYVDELKHGDAKEWFPNGQLRYHVKYDNGKVNGRVTLYDANGSVESINEYTNGALSKQIQPKEPNNVQLQTRATFMAGSGKDIYYLFVSPKCPHCFNFLEQLQKYYGDATFYVYVVPLNPQDKEERRMLELVYNEKLNHLELLLDMKQNGVDMSKPVPDEYIAAANYLVLKAQQIQLNMGIRNVPMLVDTKGFFHSVAEFEKKYSK